MVAEIGPPLEMIAHELFHRLGPEQPGVLRGPALQRLDEQRAKRPTQPFMRRNIQPGLLPLQDRSRQLLPH